MKEIVRQIQQVLAQARNILIVSHKNPDGDTLASACALMQYLRQLDKNHTAFCATPVSANLSFLPHVEYFISNLETLREQHFDVAVLMDSSDLAYAGVAEYFKELPYAPIIVNIDHHRTNNHYGQYNMVMPEAASTTEVLYILFKTLGVIVDKHLATCLLTGIATDTGHFSNPATTARSLQIAGELLRLGGNLRLIQGRTLRNKSLAALRVWGRVLSRLQKNQKYNLAITAVTQEDLLEYNLSEEDLEGLTNFLNNLSGAKAVLLLREKGDGIIKASLRTTDPQMDVSRIAKHFGGGGHAKAAGFSLPGRLEKTATGWQVI